MSSYGELAATKLRVMVDVPVHEMIGRPPSPGRCLDPSKEEKAGRPRLNLLGYETSRAVQTEPPPIVVVPSISAFFQIDEVKGPRDFMGGLEPRPDPGVIALPCGPEKAGNRLLQARLPRQRRRRSLGRCRCSTISRLPSLRTVGIVRITPATASLRLNHDDVLRSSGVQHLFRLIE